MDLLKINTAGSVDDGKSTLIGRLLYDNGALTKEQEDLIKKKTEEKGLSDLDFSVITDGLIAEREQGITIDVAHIYFSTPERKFIIADSPGHVEYTRNMVTGASNSEVSIILIDARKGLLEQTYRHYFINRLLRQSHILFCINKMDLVDYDEKVFQNISHQINNMLEQYPKQDQEIAIIPVSSLKGDNIVYKSENMTFYKGKTLSELLHTIGKTQSEHSDFRMDIQQVLHVQNEEFTDYRAYAGRIISGSISLGDTIIVLPSGKKSKVQEIRKYKTTYEKAEQGQSIQIRLSDDIDISRGSMLIKENKDFLINKDILADLVWLDEQKATLSDKYGIQAGARMGVCKLHEIHYIIPPEDPSAKFEASEISMNEISEVNIKLASPLYLDKYEDNKMNGAFILIDIQTNNTVAVGFVK